MADVNRDDLLAALETHGGSLLAAAESLGVAETTARRLVKRLGLTDELARIRTAKPAKKEKQRSERALTADKAAAGAPVDEVEVLRARVKELESLALSKRKADVDAERVLARLEDAVRASRPTVKPPRPRRAKAEPHEFALLFSDTHAAEVVTAEETLGLNSYDWQTMVRRMERLQASVLSYQAHRPYPVRTLNVWTLGDMLSGSIHEELAETNDRPTAQAVVDFGQEFAAWLAGFVPYFERIHVTCVVGNHPRAKKKPQAKNSHDNGDWVAYHVARLAAHAHETITWDIPQGSFAVTTVAERWRTLLMHGDGIRSTMPGVPWGGVARRVTTLEQQFAKAKQPLDYIALGHFHTLNAIEGVGTRTFLNGSTKGIDAYSLKAFGSGRPPSQALLTFHRERGFTDLSVIDLEPVVPASEPANPPARS